MLSSPEYLPCLNINKDLLTPPSFLPFLSPPPCLLVLATTLNLICLFRVSLSVSFRFVSVNGEVNDNCLVDCSLCHICVVYVKGGMTYSSFSFFACFFVSCVLVFPLVASLHSNSSCCRHVGFPCRCRLCLEILLFAVAHSFV